MWIAWLQKNEQLESKVDSLESSLFEEKEKLKKEKEKLEKKMKEKENLASNLSDLLRRLEALQLEGTVTTLYSWHGYRGKIETIII